MTILDDGTNAPAGRPTATLTGAATVAAPIPPGDRGDAYIVPHGGGWFGVYVDGRQVGAVQGREAAEQMAADVTSG